MKRRAPAVWVVMLAIGTVAPAAAQTSPRPEVKVTATNLADVQGPLNNLPNGGELQVRGLVVTDTNAFNSAPFTTLVSTVQNKPGTEVKLVGTVGGTPFEAKIERGEVKLQGLSFANQADFNAFVTGLGAQNNLRELRVQAVVNGMRMIAKFEDGRVRTEVRDGNRGSGSEHSGRNQARGDRDDRSGRGDRGDRPDRVERNDRSDRVERVERTERADRLDRPERSGRH